MLYRTDRLAVRPLAPDDLDAVLSVYTSNPAYLELTEGSAGEAGHYDRGMLERDLAMAELAPERTLAGIWLEGELVGVIDWLLENPNDGRPWLGLIMVRENMQRRGIAREAVTGLLSHLARQGVSVLRAAVIEGNVAGLANMRSLGFGEVEQTTVRIAAGERRLTIFERALATDGAAEGSGS